MRKSLWQLGFRPFFLFGALFAALAVLIWICHLFGWIERLGAGNPIYWHSHEMIFGFAAAIVVGFVMTAIQNWTGQPGVKGKPLQFIFLIWLLARILLAIPQPPLLLSALVDLSFFPVTVALLFPYYVRDRELKTERVFFVFFTILFLGNLLFHLDSLGWYTGYARHGIFLGLNTILLIILFIGGRVIPFFTESSIAKRQPKSRTWVEIGSYITAAGYLVSDVFVFGSKIHIGFGFLAATFHLIRLLGWQVPRVRRIPLVWVLHLAYLWIVMGFLLGSLAGLGKIIPSLAVHAFTIGGLGVIVYGMISRVSLGHTGRRLHPSIWTVAGYVLLNLSAITRVFFPMALPQYYLGFLGFSALGWIVAFLIFIFVYTPILTSPRVDGRPG